MKVPFVDLGAQYQAHKAEFDAAFAEVIERTAFIGGEPVKRFERDYAEAYGTRHCVSCANGTDAIYVALKMLGIGAGDEVITTACSWISTSETISQTGARPVFVDIDDYFVIDTDLIERAITPRTKAIIPVHLYGQAAPLAPLEAIARRHNLHLIEDCAQAHFATWDGRRVGTVGAVGTFSFYPGKNLGAYGDAGALITSDDDLARRCRMYANHGALVKHEHEIEGINSRLDGLQAALLSKKLPHVAEWTRARQRIAARYDELLADVPGVTTPKVRKGATHVFHLYVVRASNRDALRQRLAERGIEVAIHYPRPLPFLPAYARLGYAPADFPKAVAAQGEILSLPIYPEMSTAMIDYVAGTIREFYLR
jgi:dTDP-4-amino-4,6-dideoxygalactose transaminase